MSDPNQQRSGFGSVGYAVIAIICAGFAAYLMAVVMKAKGYQKEKQVEVVVATQSIGAGMQIGESAVKVVKMGESLVPQRAVTSMGFLFREGEEPRTAATGILPGEVIVKDRLGDPEKGTAMAGKVRDGHRAIAITVDESIARSRLIFPGARVDVIGTFRYDRIYYSRLLVENARVLSLESQTDVETYQTTEGDVKAPDAVLTIEVTPQQAELVALGTRGGKLDVVLRNSSDDYSIETVGVGSDDVPTGEATKLAAVSVVAAEIDADSAESEDGDAEDDGKADDDKADDDDDDSDSKSSRKDDDDSDRKARRGSRRSRVKRRPPSRDKRDIGGSSTIEVR